MSWFKKVLDEEMMWTITDGNDAAYDALEELNNADPYEKCIVAEGDGHHVIFFVGEDEDGNITLLHASVSPDWKTQNSLLRGTAGEVDNVYLFSDHYDGYETKWDDVYISEELPTALK